MKRYKEHTIQRRRISIVMTIIVILSFLVIGKLFIIQIMQNDYYTALAKNQHWLIKEIPAKRGIIFAKDKYSQDPFPMAMNTTRYLVYAIPAQIKDPKDIALKLDPILEMSSEDIEDKISNKKDVYVRLKRKLSKEKIEEIENLELEGISFQSENLRSYPEGKLASCILGFVDAEGNGKYGIENYFDDDLKGETGVLKTERDIQGIQILVGQENLYSSSDGNDYILTIDRTIQYKVESILKDHIERHGAKSGNAIVLDPNTGAVLAMVCYPTFDPNLYYEQEDYQIFENTNISSVFEPGSIFKPIAMAAGLDLEKISPDTTHYCKGSVQVGVERIYTADRKAHGTESMIEVLKESCNVGIIFVIRQIGGEQFYNYLKKFGFSEPTGIELSGEISGDIKDISEWKEINFATASFGQGIAVTPLQMITSFAAIANGGKLMRPYIVDEVIFPQEQKESKKTEPKIISEVIAEDKAETLKAILVSVVERGHGYQAKVPGYRVAGKTGTAEIPDEEGGYAIGKNIGSFIGFGPVDDPQFVVMVKIDEPKGVDWAESTATPAVGEILEWLFNYYQIFPTEDL